MTPPDRTMARERRTPLARYADPEPRTIRLALAGCGVVGGSLLRLLRERGPAIEARHGLRFELARVLVRDGRRRRAPDLPPELVTTDPAEFLAADAGLVVEAIGGLDPALTIARAALSRGRDLVTANKALLASHAVELAELARASCARLEFEAAVGGGAPVIQTLRDSLAESDVVSIRGILNGTSNFILTRLSEGASYATALDDARRAGFAEADPTRDLDGTDAADKIRILAWLAFGVDPSSLEVDRRGLLPDPEALARAALGEGGVLRLIAECRRVGERVTAAVAPVVCEPDSEWARTRGEENLVVIETRWNGTIRVAGPGAGGSPTAAAVLSDLVRAAIGRGAGRRRRAAA